MLLQWYFKDFRIKDRLLCHKYKLSGQTGVLSTSVIMTMLYIIFDFDVGTLCCQLYCCILYILCKSTRITLPSLWRFETYFFFLGEKTFYRLPNLSF